MSYENAPATQLVATDCACCGRPLVDAKSVEIGMGPHCRKRHGLDIPCSDEVRAQANKLVHGIALDRSRGVSVGTLQAVEQLRALGFDKLASILQDRLADIKLVEAEGQIRIFAPYSEAALPAFRSLPGRRWNAEAKCNTVPATAEAKRALWALLKTHYAGKLGMGARGPFAV